MRDLPVVLMFYIFPIVSLLLLWIKGIAIVNYDYVWGGLLGYILIRAFFKKVLVFDRVQFIFLSILLVLIICKYILPYFWYDHIVLKAAIMDGKWIVYLLFSVLWVRIYGYPSISVVYNGCLFFSTLYIIVAVLRILSGTISRAGILMESNYDGFMILMVYCFIDNVSQKVRWGHVIMIVATFCTLSRTGTASLFAIMFLKFIKKKPYLLLAFIPFVAIAIYLGLSIRGDSAENLDRFVYFSQAFMYFDSVDWSMLLLGSTPGISLKMPVLSEFEWTISNFENMRDLQGIFPFYFHSTYLRLAFTWGILIALGFIFYFIMNFFRAKYEPLRWLCVLVLIQSFSLSTLTLPNVSVLFFLLFMLALKGQKDATKLLT